MLKSCLLYFHEVNLKKMVQYSVQEYADMLRCYETAGGRSSNAAANLYRERFPNRQRFPNHRVITRLLIRIRNGEQFVPQNAGAGAPRRIRRPWIQERILRLIRNNPRTSLRVIARALNLSYSTVRATVSEAGYVVLYLKYN